MASDTLELIEGDANVTLTGVVFDIDTKKPMDLTDYTLALHFWNFDDHELKETLVPTIIDPLKGTYEVIVTPECMEFPGSFEFEMQLTKGIVIQTLPRRQRAVVKSQRG